MKAVLEGKPKTAAEYYEVADFFASHPNPALVRQAVDGAAAIEPSDPRLPYYRGVALILECGTSVRPDISSTSTSDAPRRNAGTTCP